MSERYFELSVSEDGKIFRRRYTDSLLRLCKIPLGELLEAEIESLRQECIKEKSDGEAQAAAQNPCGRCKERPGIGWLAHPRKDSEWLCPMCMSLDLDRQRKELLR